MRTEKPNILVVMADQMSALSLRAYGNRVSKAPALGRLARGGMVFENFYCNYPLCAPSRFAFMAGRLPSRIGAYDNAAELPASVPTFAHYLRRHGYYTCLSGKMHFVGPDQLHGFEDRLTTEIYPADFGWTPLTSYEQVNDEGKTQADPGVSSVDTVADALPRARTMQLDYDEEVAHRAIQKIYDLARHKTEPFLLVASFTHPHDPYTITREYWDLYRSQDIDQPRVAPIPLERLDPHSRGLHFHYGLHRCPISDEARAKARQGYYAMISFVDAKLQSLLSALEAAGLAENTVVMFTSDHGDMMGERGMWFKKTMFEPAVRVPLVLHFPDGRLNGRCAAPASLVDVLPTMTEIAGLGGEDFATEVDGQSLLSVAADPQRAAERPIFCEHLDGATTAPRVMVRMGRYKYVASRDYPPQLYDLESDPSELVNLSGTAPMARVEQQLIDCVNRTWDLGQLKADVTESQAVRRFLFEALSQGRIEGWDYVPQPEPQSRFVRRGDMFPQVERRGYLSYPDVKS